MLDVPVRRQDKQLAPFARCEVQQMLRRQVVQPRQTLRTADRDDATVAPVDQGDVGLHCALFAHRVAVVGDEIGIARARFEIA